MLPQKFSLRRENQLLASSVGKPCELNLDLNKQNQVDSSQSGSKRTSGILVLEVLPADTPCDVRIQKCIKVYNFRVHKPIL